MNSVEVEVFGRKMKIRGSNPDRILAVADFVNRQIDALQDRLRTTDNILLISMTSMLIAEKLFETEESTRDLQKRLDRIDLSLGAFLDEDK